MMSTTTKTDEKMLAPFEIWEVMLDNSTIKFFQPLVLQPEWLPDDPDEPDENEYLAVKVPELDIAVFAEDFDDLIEAVHSNIRVNWRHYVLPPIDQISAQAKTVRRAYLDIAEAFNG